MTPQQLKAMNLALEALQGLIKKTSGQSIYSFMETERRIAMSACVFVKEALAEHAMRETQRLGQEIEPVADYIAARDMLDAKPVPPRTWVGLTDEDMYVVAEEESCSFIAGAKWSEEILKGKNA